MSERRTERVLLRAGRLVESFRLRLGLTWTGVLAVAVAVGAAALAAVALAGVSDDVVERNGLEASDASRLQEIVTHRSDVLVAVAKVATQLGNVVFLVAVAVLVGVVLWRWGARLAVAAAPLVALGLAAVAAAVGKQLFSRARPPVALQLVPETEPSFPSGHATDSAALYLTIGLIVAVVVLRRPVARVASILLASVAVIAVGASRLVLGVHWPTDVLAGWALGSLVALLLATTVVVVTRWRPASPSSDSGRVQLLARSARRMLVAQRAQRHVSAPAPS
jgi:membrane-associated phospholipid phosphatase